jgi:hypothetical protein
MRGATALDLANRRDFPEFQTLAEQVLTNHTLSIDAQGGSGTHPVALIAHHGTGDWLTSAIPRPLGRGAFIPSPGKEISHQHRCRSLEVGNNGLLKRHMPAG